LSSSSPPELSSGSCIEDLRLARHGNLPAQQAALPSNLLLSENNYLFSVFWIRISSFENRTAVNNFYNFYNKSPEKFGD
jgi:hypothetical protein